MLVFYSVADKVKLGVALHQQPVISREEHHHCVSPSKEMHRRISMNAWQTRSLLMLQYLSVHVLQLTDHSGF